MNPIQSSHLHVNTLQARTPGSLHYQLPLLYRDFRSWQQRALPNFTERSLSAWKQIFKKSLKLLNPEWRLPCLHVHSNPRTINRSVFRWRYLMELWGEGWVSGSLGVTDGQWTPRLKEPHFPSFAQPQDLSSSTFQISAEAIRGNNWGLEKRIVCNLWQQTSCSDLWFLRDFRSQTLFPITPKFISKTAFFTPTKWLCSWGWTSNLGLGQALFRLEPAPKEKYQNQNAEIES